MLLVKRLKRFLGGRRTGNVFRHTPGINPVRAHAEIAGRDRRQVRRPSMRLSDPYLKVIRTTNDQIRRRWGRRTRYAIGYQGKKLSG